MTMLYGNNPQAVVELLNSRKTDNKITTTQEKRSRKLALIVEGGAMRGVLSAGSLLAIDLLGFRSCFDEIYATSAGAVNAAYFLSGQGELGITVYFDDISNKKFFNPLRFTKIVDVDYVYDHIVPIVKPLNEINIKNSHTNLYMSVTNVNNGENELINTKSFSEPIAKVLKASNALPILYNRTVTLNGEQYIDGGASNPLPVRQAIANGCTDILILLSKDKNHTSLEPTIIQRLIYYLMLTRKYPKMMDCYKELFIQANESRKLALEGDPNNNINIATICPTEIELIVNKITMDRDKLVEGAYMQAVKTFKFFSGDKEKLDHVFNQYRTQD